MWLIPLASLGIGVYFFALAVITVFDDRRKPRWRWWHSLDAYLYTTGFACTILTSLYAFTAAVIWL